MKKKISVLLFSIALISCNKTENQILEQNDIYSEILNKYPNIRENELVLNNATEYLNSKIDSLISNGHLNKFYYKAMVDIKNSKKDSILVHFYSTSDVNQSDNVQVEILSYMASGQASDLNENKLYNIEFSEVKSLSKEEANKISTSLIFSPELKVVKDYRLKYNLGVFHSKKIVIK